MGSCREFLWWIRIRGTVLPAIWWQVFLLGVYTVGIAALQFYLPGFHIKFPQTMITILGVVVSLLLAFRTNNAYDRYWEGRRLWTVMTQQIRRMTRAIWLGVSPIDPSKNSAISKAVVERRSALNLSLAFVISVKHYLREEYSYDYDDLRTLIKHLPRFNTPSSNLPLDIQRRIAREHKMSKMAYEMSTPTNIPIEISYFYLSYIQYLEKNQLAAPWALKTMKSALGTLVDVLSDFERILRTPIPLAYSIHLNQSVWLYLLSIPYQIIADLGWWTVPVTMFAGFFMLGLLAIGNEIENPFGYDANDLPLDDFCLVMKREIEVIVGNYLPDAEEWIFSENNFPLGAAFPLNAKALAAKPPEEIMRIFNRISSTPPPPAETLIRAKSPLPPYGSTSKGYQTLP